jgi:hypothetical protein
LMRAPRSPDRTQTTAGAISYRRPDSSTRVEGIARPQDLADSRDFVEHGEGSEP